MFTSTTWTPGERRRAACRVALAISSAKCSRIRSGLTSSTMRRNRSLQALRPRRCRRSGARVRLTARSENSTTMWPARTAARPSFWRMANKSTLAVSRSRPVIQLKSPTFRIRTGSSGEGLGSFPVAEPIRGGTRWTRDGVADPGWSQRRNDRCCAHGNARDVRGLEAG